MTWRQSRLNKRVWKTPSFIDLRRGCRVLVEKSLEAGEVAQQLRLLAALAQDLSLGPSSHTAQLIPHRTHVHIATYIERGIEWLAGHVGSWLWRQEAERWRLAFSSLSAFYSIQDPVYI